MKGRYILLIVVVALFALAVGFGIGIFAFASNGTPAIRIAQGNILLEAGNITLGDITLWERGGCLATRHFTTLGHDGEAGFLRIAHGVTPTGEHASQSGFLQIYAKSDDLLYLMNSVGAEQQIVNLSPDGTLHILDSINAKEGFATQLWDVSGGNWETALVNTEYYSPNQQGGFYGTVYRQYFTTTLPSSLTSGNGVSNLIDYQVIFKYAAGTSRGLAHGSTASVTDNQVYIVHSGASGSGNLSWDIQDYTVVNGWVDYTKP